MPDQTENTSSAEPAATPAIPKTSLADRILAEDAKRQHELEDMRVKKMKDVAKYRWLIANGQHRTQTGAHLDFDRWPFLKEVYQSEAQHMVLIGAAGSGKTDFSIVDGAARAACGLRVFYVYDNAQKRNKEVLGRIDPTFHSVPFYSGMLAAAKKDRSAEVDSAGLKHFGPGSILFIGSESESEFSSHRADSATIEEHQLCNKDNLRKIFHRQTGSDYRFTVINGNPRVFGSKEMQNLHFLYMESDQRRWEIPCPHCWQFQELGWWSHFVDEKKNEFGAILAVDIRDQGWDPQARKLEPRPVCLTCHEPMTRLSDFGRWIPRNPGHWRHGWNFSNLFNPTANINELLDYYRAGLHDPKARAEFVNDQLGLPYNFSGSNITVEMLEAASTGIAAGMEPYSLIPAGEIAWREIAA